MPTSHATRRRRRASAASVAAFALAAAVVAVVAGAGVAVAAPRAFGAPIPASVIKGFVTDGFRIVNNITMPGKSFVGVVAESKNVTNLATGQPKRAYYVEGDAYSMGWLMGALAPTEVEAMATTYLAHIIPSLLAPGLDMQLASDPKTKGWYDALCDILGYILVEHGSAAFNEHVNEGVVPQEYVTEMQGVVDGAQTYGAGPNVTLAALITLNWGSDWLFANLYTGNILHILTDAAATLPTRFPQRFPAERTRAIVDWLAPQHFRGPVMCDAFAARGAATASGSSSYFVRDFQFSTALVFQDIAAPVIYSPTDGRRPLVSIGAPGFIGSMTAMNDVGVAMGVDVLRAADCNATRPGFNSLLLVRDTVHNSQTSEQAVDHVADATRGVTWLYPLSDASGDGRVLETGQSYPEGQQPDYWAFVKDVPGLVERLPTAQTLAGLAMQPDYRKGLFARNMSYAFPNDALLPYNPGLFELAKMSYNASAFTSPDGYVFQTFQEEHASWGALASRYFSPARELATNPDVIVVSNFAFTPQMRIAQMATWPSIIPSEAMQWRYDVLHALVSSVVGAGAMDLFQAQRLVAFLGPCPNATDPDAASFVSVYDTIAAINAGQRGAAVLPAGKWHCTPDYWTERLVSSEPRSALVQGSVVATDLQARIMLSLVGYWKDGWLQTTLPAYL